MQNSTPRTTNEYISEIKKLKHNLVEEDISTLELSDIIDTEVLRSLMENFYQLTGMLGAIIDLSGKVLVAVGWQDICTKFHRCNPNTLNNCIESDTLLTTGVLAGTSKAYHCKNNMWDIVTPIIVGGKHIGNVFMGQYFLEDEVPDYEFFRKQAKKHGFDEKEYLEALDRVPRFSKKMIDAGMNFYSKLVGIISTLSYNSIQQSRMLAESKLAEQALRESEDRYKLLFERNSDALFIYDPITKEILEANKATSILYGYSTEEILGKSVVELSAEKEQTVTQLEKIEKEGQVHVSLRRHKKKDGSIVYVDIKGFKINLKDKEVMFAVSKNITDRVLAEAAIKKQNQEYEVLNKELIQANKDLFIAKDLAEESEDKLRIITNNLPILISRIDRNLKYLFVNQYYYERSLYKSGIIGKDMIEVLGEETYNRAYPYIQKVLSGEFVSFENSTTHAKNNELVIFETQYIPHIVNGQVESFFVLGMDISERKLAEKELLRSEERYRKLYVNTPALLHSIDNEGRIQSVSKRWLEKLGYELNEVIGHKSTEFLTEKSYLHATEHYLPKIFKEGYINNVPYQYITKSGDVLDILLSAISEKDEKGNITHSLAVLEDVTERKIQDVQLRKSEEKFRALFEQTGGYCMILNPNTSDGIPVIVDANEAACLIHGYERDAFIGKPISDVDDEAGKSLIKMNTAEIMKGKPFHTENVHIRKDGTHFNVAVNAKRIDIEGEPPLIFSVEYNITERIKAEKALKESEKKYRELINLAQEGIWVIDENNITNFANPCMAKMLGYTPEEMIGKALFDFMDDTGVKIANENLELRKEGLKEQHDFEFICKNNSRIFCTITTAPIIDASGNYQGTIAGIIDISERKKAERILAKEKKIFKDLFNNVNSGIAIYKVINDGKFGKDYIIEKFNKKALKLEGKTSDEVIGKSLFDLRPLIDTYGLIPEFREVWKTGIGKTYPTKIYIDENFSNYYENRIFCLPNKNIVAIYDDVTEKKRNEQKIIESEENLKNTFDLSPSIISKANLDTGYFVEANQAVTRILGYTVEEFLSTPFIELIHPDDQQESTDEKDNQLKGKEVTFFENRYLCKNGSYKWMAWHGTKADKNGIVTAIGSDISTRKTAELETLNANEKALENEEKYRLLHENAGLGIGYYNPDGTIISFNSIASQDMNGVPEDFAGKSIFELFPKETADSYFIRIQKAVKSNEIKVYEDSVQSPHQKNWFLSTYTKIVNSKKEILGIQIISQNITQIKEYEVELKISKEKAEESDRLKSAFLANMSHEIRTPMNGILGFANLLKTRDLKVEKQQQFINIIEKSGQRMLSIINDIIDISKIEAGQMQLVLSDSNVNHQTEYIYSFFKPEVEAKGIQFSYKNPLPTEEAIIHTDNEKLYAILTNLVKNAIKYCNEGSIEFGYCKEGQFLEFYVKDTGVGIEKDRKDAIFERFVQADIADKMALQGAGLGLSISKAYVQMLGGKIWLESEFGLGSTFYFTIPYKTRP